VTTPPESLIAGRPATETAIGRPLPRWPAFAIALVAAMLFVPAVRFGFVYDARCQILTDTFLYQPRHWFDVLTCRVMAMDVIDFNRPLHLASLMFDAAVWGRNSFGFHLTSMLLHAANTALVWLVVRELLAISSVGSGAVQTSEKGAVVDFESGRQIRLALAMVATAVFAVHPLVAEPVCEPTYREDLLVTFFSLLAILMAIRHNGSRAGRDLGRAAACISCCLLAIAAKESAAVTPVLLAVYWWLFRRGDESRFWWLAVSGSTVVVTIFLAMRFALDPTPGVINDEQPGYPGGSLGAAMLILPRILAFYVQLVVAPVNLCADYGGESIRHLSLPTALAALLGVAAAALLGARRDRRLLFAYAMILLPLVPVANVVPIFRPFADRYLYFPLAGVALALACLGDAPWMVSRVRRLALAFGLVAVVVLALACRQRQRVWADSLTLWSDTFAKNPGSPTAAINAAMAFSDAGRLGEAEFAAQRAIVLTGGNALSFFAHLALILDKQGRPDVARRALEKALELPLMADPEALVDRLYMEPVDAQRYRELLEKQGMLTARTSSE
jgi:hypothetical protein